MAFQQQGDPTSSVIELRSQGLTDDLIMEELTKKGLSPEQINQAIMQLDSSAGQQPIPEPMPGQSLPSGFPGEQPTSNHIGVSSRMDPMGERIEEIAESIIDEKWDELIAEVRKIVIWKEGIESKQAKINNDLEKLKEDFKVLHQGVLGKLENYDVRMRDVGTELKAVGKVFKDVVPEFVENVKELSHITGKIKPKKE